MTTTGTRRRVPLLLGALVLVALVLAVVVVLVRDEPQRAVLREPPTSATGSADREDATAALVEELQAAVTGDDVAAAEELAAPEDSRARTELRTLVHNAGRLDLEGVAFRYLAPGDRELSPGEERRYGEDAWLSEIQVTWQLGGPDSRPSTVEVPLVTSGSGDAAAFESFRTEGERIPLWLLAALERRDAGEVTVLAPRGQLARLVRQGVEAVATVRRTLPRFRGPLVVEASPGVDGFRAASGLTVEAAAQIAAVTTTADGSAVPDAPVRVFLNPEVFAPLGAQGQQIVLSHEAAHVALGAAQTAAPLWLSEGVADYVALVDNPLPVSVLGAQILRKVRAEGPPRQLPGPAEFDGSDPAIGAWYESAWLAARLVAERYGEPQLLELYRTVNEGGSLDTALREVLGTTEPAFVREWRGYLAELAG